jgi:hypothetical protein
MLIHAILHWPDIIQESLWPFAVKLAIDIHNSTPTPSGLCPLEIFSGHKNIHPNNRSNFHTFGCPIFVLDPSLRQNHKIPKWKPRSRVGVYLGQSSEHASSVPLVLSTTTDLVSPQFHVVFDDKFSTVDCLHSNKLPANWANLFTTSSVIYVDEDFTKMTYYPFSQPNSTNNSTPFEPSTSLQRESITSPIFQREPSSPLQTTTVQHIEHPTIHQPPTITPPGWNNLHPYNTRFKKQHIATFSSLTDIPTFSDQIFKSYLSTHDLFPSQHDPSFQHIQHHAFTANTKDVLNFREMQSDTDRALFETDMQRELADLISSGTLELTPRSSTSLLNKALQPIWSFQRKRAPDWSIIKHKSLLCPHGGMQVEGINFWATYAPVVSWHTVRLTLILSLLSGLKSRQVDYISTYTQAPIDCNLYINIPPGFIVNNNNLSFTRSSTKRNSSDYVLCIKRNMYCLKQAGNNWFDTLKTSLLTRGFTQSAIDPCLFPLELHPSSLC